MSRLEGAIEQFSQALDRLEHAVGKRGAGVERGPDKTGQREIQALREDRARLASELDHVRSEFMMLEKTSDEVESRLDGAIRDIRRVLGSA